jgi:Family of unknown function (DUF5946)
VTHCTECGATLEEGAVCRDYFHELLILEANVPGSAGADPHFFAVASYNLQHPSGFTVPTLAGLRDTLRDVLAGRATLADARRRARESVDGSTRVTRHADAPPTAAERDALATWPRMWPLTVRDVCRVEPEAYVAAVRGWAASIVATLDAA